MPSVTDLDSTWEALWRRGYGTGGSAWGINGNTNGGLKKIGTLDAYAFPIYTNNAERARFTSTGTFGFGTTTPYTDFDIQGTANVWTLTDSINDIALLSDNGLSVEYTGHLDSKNYITANGGVLNYSGSNTNKVGDCFGTFGLAYYMDAGGYTLAGIGNQPALSGVGAKVWINNNSDNIGPTAGVTSFFANVATEGGTVTDAYGYWAGWDDVNNAGTTNSYKAFFVPTLSAITGIPAATSRWGIYIQDPVANYFAGSIGIGNTAPNAKSVLDMASTTKGVLMPRMSTAQRDAIATPPEGLQIYDLTTHKMAYYNGTAWVEP